MRVKDETLLLFMRHFPADMFVDVETHHSVFDMIVTYLVASAIWCDREMTSGCSYFD